MFPKLEKELATTSVLEFYKLLSDRVDDAGHKKTNRRIVVYETTGGHLWIYVSIVTKGREEVQWTVLPRETMEDVLTGYLK